MTDTRQTFLPPSALTVASWCSLADDLLSLLAKSSSRETAFLIVTPAEKAPAMPEAAPKAVATTAEDLEDLFAKMDRELDEMDLIHPSSPPRVIDEVCLRPRPATLMAALQIAKTFETQEALEAALSDRSQITVLCAHAAKLAPSVALLLNAASAQGAEEAPFVARVSEVLREGSDSAGRTFSGLRDMQLLTRFKPVLIDLATALCTQKRIEGAELERHLSKVTNMRAEAAEDVTADFS